MSLGPTAVGSGKGASMHDNLKPFEKIGEVWGKEVFPPRWPPSWGVWDPG